MVYKTNTKLLWSKQKTPVELSTSSERSPCAGTEQNKKHCNLYQVFSTDKSLPKALITTRTTDLLPPPRPGNGRHNPHAINRHTFFVQPDFPHRSTPRAQWEISNNPYRELPDTNSDSDTRTKPCSYVFGCLDGCVASPDPRGLHLYP